MFGWFKPKSVLTDNQRDWIDWRFSWFHQHFGEEPLRRPMIVPSNDFFPDPYFGTREDALKLFERVCEYMHIDRSRINVQFYNRRGDGYIVRWGTHAAGLYTRDRSGQIQIWLEESELFDGAQIVATSAHELAHVYLLADGHCDGTEPDQEHLTDLLVFYFGLGIFTANSIRRDKSWYQGNMAFSSQRFLGYLKMPEAAYALALYAHKRKEQSPVWAKKLRADVRADFKEELRQLANGHRVCWAGNGDERPEGVDSLFISSKDNNDTASEPTEESSMPILSKADDSTPDVEDDEVDDDDRGIANRDHQDATEADELFTTGVYYNSEGRYLEAIESFTHAFELNPSDSEPLLERARSHLFLGNFAETIRDASHRLERRPNDRYARRYRAEGYIATGRYQDALNDLDQIRRADLEGRDFLLRGLACFLIGDHRNSIKHLTLGINKNPHRADFYLARSEVYAALDDPKRAQRDLDEAVRRNPDYTDKEICDSVRVRFLQPGSSIPRNFDE